MIFLVLSVLFTIGFIFGAIIGITNADKVITFFVEKENIIHDKADIRILEKEKDEKI